MKKIKLTVVILILLLTALCSAFAESWAGTYLWVNPTKKDNNGKCTQIKYVVKDIVLEDGTQSFEVWDATDENNLRRIFPIEYMPEGGYSWHKWNEKSTEAENYRFNAEKFNTTSYTPSKWRVIEIQQDELFGTCIVETVAFIFNVQTKSYFTLRYNTETGIKELAYMTDGDGMVSMGLFFNPAPGEEGKKVFVLTKQD